jgi:hypothetical protein
LGSEEEKKSTGILRRNGETSSLVVSPNFRKQIAQQIASEPAIDILQQTQIIQNEESIVRSGKISYDSTSYDAHTAASKSDRSSIHSFPLDLKSPSDPHNSMIETFAFNPTTASLFSPNGISERDHVLDIREELHSHIPARDSPSWSSSNEGVNDPYVHEWTSSDWLDDFLDYPPMPTIDTDLPVAAVGPTPPSFPIMNSAYSSSCPALGHTNISNSTTLKTTPRFSTSSSHHSEKGSSSLYKQSTSIPQSSTVHYIKSDSKLSQTLAIGPREIACIYIVWPPRGATNHRRSTKERRGMEHDVEYLTKALRNTRLER